MRDIRKAAPEAVKVVVAAMRGEGQPLALRLKAAEILLDKALGSRTAAAELQMAFGNAAGGGKMLTLRFVDPTGCDDESEVITISPVPEEAQQPHHQPQLLAPEAEPVEPVTNSDGDVAAFKISFPSRWRSKGDE